MNRPFKGGNYEMVERNMEFLYRNDATIAIDMDYRDYMGFVDNSIGKVDNHSLDYVMEV